MASVFCRGPVKKAAVMIFKLKRRLFSTTQEQVEDYVAAIRTLLWQRQGIFLAAAVLALFYFNPFWALLCYAAVVGSELLDLRLAREVSTWKSGAPVRLNPVLRRIVVNTVISALTISAFVITVALQQTSGGHFTPLFFLFAAALFAAMNNHQIIAALVIRLTIYGGTFLFIALLDIVRYAPPLSSAPWLQFFTVAFVTYFIIDVSRVFLGMYDNNLSNMRKLRREHKRTKEALQIKSNFVSTVSHELRTPLTSIKGSLDLINAGVMGDVPENLRNLLEIAGRNSARLEELINDVLDVQKLETDTGVEEFTPVHVETLLRESVEVNQAFADKHNVSLSLVGAQCDVSVMGLERRLIQVMTNLISNAVKFSNDGGEVEIWAEQTPGNVRVCVCDYGVGIPPGSKDKVFGHFTQIDSSDQREIGGSGLGMSISKQIVEHYGGTLDYVSRFGEGTTFFFDLKACELPGANEEMTQPMRDATSDSLAAE